MRGKKGIVVSAFSAEATLKRKIRNHLRKLGFTRGPQGSLVAPASSKQSIRKLHFEQRRRASSLSVRSSNLRSQNFCISSQVEVMSIHTNLCRGWSLSRRTHGPPPHSSEINSTPWPNTGRLRSDSQTENFLGEAFAISANLCRRPEHSDVRRYMVQPGSRSVLPRVAGRTHSRPGPRFI
jgi:hypothetical protein